jgi:hypothetical protein
LVADTTLRGWTESATPTSTDDTLLPFSLPSNCQKKVTAAFDGGRISSACGVRLRAGADRPLDLIDTLAAIIPDHRDPALHTHSMAEILRARVFARVFAIVILWLSARRRPGHRPSGIKGTDVMGKPSDPCSLTATQSVRLILDGSLRAQDVTEPASRTVPSVNRPSRLRAFRSRICTEVGGVGPRRPGEGSSNQDQGRARHRRYAQSVRVTVWGELATQGGIPHLWLGQGQPERCFTTRLSQQYGERHAGAAGAADGAGGTTGTRTRHRTLGIRRSDGDTGQHQNAGSGRRRRRFGRTAWGKGFRLLGPADGRTVEVGQDDAG